MKSTMRGVVVLVLALSAACGRDASAVVESEAAEVLRPAPAVARTVPAPSAPALTVHEEAAPSGLDALPWPDRIGIERAMAENDPRFAPRMDEGGPVLETPGSVVATFSARGARIAIAGGEATLRAAALGRGGSMRPLDASAPAEVVGAEVRTPRGGGVVEWWRSLPSGLEHGVTIAERPAGEGPLRLEVAVTGGFAARSVSDDAVELTTAAGESVATYAHLVVLDAVGARLPARMSTGGDRVALAIDDAGARYPIVVDPLVTAQEAILVAGGLDPGAAADEFGIEVALTSDGTRAVVGARMDDVGALSNAGSARVFLRTGTTWTQEAVLVIPSPSAAADDRLGISVAITSDGTRALVGAYLADSVAGGIDAGSAWVFVRTVTTWAAEGLPLLSPTGATTDSFGSCVSLAADGSRALVGAYHDDIGVEADAGSAHVFVRSGAAWSYEAPLPALNGAADDLFGDICALAGDGNRAFVSANADDTTGGMNAGSVTVFLRTGTTWAREGPPLVASDGALNDRFGISVAASFDGTRAIVGAYYADTPRGTDAGSAYVFLRTGAIWAQETALRAPDGAIDDQFGRSVALSVDGSRALVGSFLDDTTGGTDAGTDAGSAWAFVRAGTSWDVGTQLLATGRLAYDHFGRGVALSSDGIRALVGAPIDDTAGGMDAGSARVFTLLDTNGTACTAGATCASTFCVDGVCCNSACTASACITGCSALPAGPARTACIAACGGGASDCQACSAALTGGTSGTCAALSASVASTITCRLAAAPCDAPEVCSSASTSCPADGRYPATTLCRIATSACDVEELCDGASPTCPPNVFASAATACGSVVGACDAPDHCAGTSDACLPVVQVVGISCRAASTSCDVGETCDGVSPSCPPNVFASAATACGSVAGACDVPDRCAGTTDACVPVYAAAGSECRASSGGMSCDPAETCDGTTALCPADTNMCTPDAPDGGDRGDGGPVVMPDAGDAGDVGPRDASLDGGDGGSSPPFEVSGCRCGVAQRAASSKAALLLLAVLGFVLLARRTRTAGPGRRSLRRRASLVALGSVLALAPTAAAAAQVTATTDPTTDLLPIALREYEAGNYQEAAALFAQVHAVHPTARTERALGNCAFSLRRYREAVEWFVLALADGRSPLSAEMRASVEALLVQANAFVGRFVLRVEPPEATVVIDGATVDVGPVVLDLGEHEVLASAEGYLVNTRRLVVRGAEDETLTIALVRADAAATDVTAASDADPDAPVASGESEADASDSGAGLRTAGWVTAILGGVLIAGGAVAAGVWADGLGQLNADLRSRTCRADPGTESLVESTPACLDAQSRYRTALPLTWIGFAGGAAAIATGIALVAVAPSPTGGEVSVACGPFADIGVACAGRF